jgi:hypothetical protein
MIKFKKINEINVVKDWGETKLKPLFKNQADITGENLYFPNIIITSQKGAGKTVLAVNLIRLFATNKTKIIIFSTTFTTGDDKSAFDDLKEKYPGMIEVYPKIKTKEGDVLSRKIEDAKERYDIIKQKDYDHTFPNMIFLYDDLNSDDMKDESLDYIFRTNRHIGCINILIEHRINTAATTTMRDNTDIICLFSGLSTDQLGYIFEMVNIPNLTKKDFLRIYNKATEGKRNFLFVNKTNREMRKNLSDIIYIE